MGRLCCRSSRVAPRGVVALGRPVVSLVARCVRRIFSPMLGGIVVALATRSIAVRAREFLFFLRLGLGTDVNGYCTNVDMYTDFRLGFVPSSASRGMFACACHPSIH
jgi:hypothetical protein